MWHGTNSSINELCIHRQGRRQLLQSGGGLIRCEAWQRAIARCDLRGSGGMQNFWRVFRVSEIDSSSPGSCVAQTALLFFLLTLRCILQVSLVNEPVFFRIGHAWNVCAGTVMLLVREEEALVVSLKNYTTFLLYMVSFINYNNSYYNFSIIIHSTSGYEECRSILLMTRIYSFTSSTPLSSRHLLALNSWS